jgi:hypothetical protein
MEMASGSSIGRGAFAGVVTAGIGVTLLLASGCAPLTQYRYSALTPAAQPVAWDGRTEHEGFARFEGSASGVEVNQNLFPQLHSTALMIPTWTVEGAAMFAVAPHLEIGIRGNYAAYQWTTPSAVGTMPVPDDPPSWGAGPEMRVSLPVDKERHFYIGIVGSAVATQVPYAEWTLTGPYATPATPPCNPSATCVLGAGQPYGLTAPQPYMLSSTQTETHVVWTLGVVPSYAFGPQGEYGHVFGAISATSGFQNDGFTNTASNGSTVNDFWPLFIGSVGYGIPIDVMRLAVQGFKPFTNPGSPVDYGFGLQFTVGVAAELWEGHHKD